MDGTFARRIGLVLAAVALLPDAAVGEGRAPDRVATTAGYTSGIQLVSGSAEVSQLRYEVWLRGDHATIRAHYQLTASNDRLWLGIAAGTSKPSGAAPGDLRPGHFPTLLVWNGDATNMPIDVEAWKPTAPGSGKVPRPAFGFESSPAPAATLHRWQMRGAEGAAVWTVPYAGDSYGTAGSLDCSCGDPYVFSISNAFLVVDPSANGLANASGSVELVIHNESGSAARLWPTLRETSSFELTPHATRTLSYGSGTRGPLLVSFLRGWKPGSESHIKNPQTGPSFWPSSLQFSCSPPTKPSADEPFLPAYDQPWALRCKRTRGSDVSSFESSIPSFLHSWMPPTSSWHNETTPVVDWFMAGMYRAAMNGDGPSSFQQWPSFEAKRARIAPSRYRLSASSTLGGAAGRNSVANLSDGKPDTAWCEGDDGYGIGTELTIEFDTPTKIAKIGLLPGMVRADWLYEANAAPTSALIYVDPTKPDRNASYKAKAIHHWWAPSLPSAEVYKEGLWAPVTDVTDTGRRFVVRITNARAGRYAGDMCISELMLFE
ncbi:MAG: hypothetical protein AB7O24_25385 [Kofleriaceae bacterium]